MSVVLFSKKILKKNIDKNYKSQPMKTSSTKKLYVLSAISATLISFRSAFSISIGFLFPKLRFPSGK